MSDLRLAAGARRKMLTTLGRLKGGSIESLERIKGIVDACLEYLKDNGNGADLPGHLQHDIHTAHTAMGKLMSNQQQARTVMETLDIIGVGLK